jgi:hypothetical protein
VNVCCASLSLRAARSSVDLSKPSKSIVGQGLVRGTTRQAIGYLPKIQTIDKARSAGGIRGSEWRGGAGGAGGDGGVGGVQVATGDQGFWSFFSGSGWLFDFWAEAQGAELAFAMDVAFRGGVK